jgi:asparagine synthase (glutamine-hydrolysing)
MCGICGKLEFDLQRSVDPELLRNMMTVIRHRGPDDEGTYLSGNVGLGHRRLSIIDLNTGKQPLANETNTVWIVFNGEIYNYRELRLDLVKRGHRFRTETDTEVIVHLYEEYGEGLLNKLRGMFAFALWDDDKKILLLARDRVGIKPLYYSQTKSALLFSSELKSILVDPTVPREIDPAAVDRFLTYNYTPGAETTLKGICKLLPGHYLISRSGQIEIRQYWDLKFVPREQNGESAADELTELLRETVRGHMISDGPVGVLLSGGVDSTAMLSFASELTTERINTFTIGFSGSDAVDERPYARLASKRFNSLHFETTINGQDFVDFLPKYVWHMEEPVCEPPAVALFYVSKLASQHVKVLLSGEGGDEAFAGYPEYRNYPFLERVKSVLGPLTNTAAGVANLLANVPSLHKLKKYSALMRMPLQNYYYSRSGLPISFFVRNFDSIYSGDFHRQIDHDNSFRVARELFQNVADQPILNQMLYVDTKTWLPDDLLIKADKITMANSLELRVPLLDHRVLEFAASLPISEKLRGLQTKRILRQALSKHVPAEILNRPKAGFPVPYRSWLRKDMNGMVRDTLLSSRATNRGYFSKRAVERLVSNGSIESDHSSEIFSLLVLELWSQIFLDDCGRSPATK